MRKFNAVQKYKSFHLPISQYPEEDWHYTGVNLAAGGAETMSVLKVKRLRASILEILPCVYPLHCPSQGVEAIYPWPLGVEINNNLEFC